MGIVIDIDEVFLADAVVETAAYTGEGLEAMTQLVVVDAAGKSHRGGGDSVLDIDERGTVEFEVVEDTVGGTVTSPTRLYCVMSEYLWDMRLLLSRAP